MKQFYILMVAFFLWTSCGKEPIFLTPPQKLEGEWVYTKAVWVANYGFTRKNVLDEFTNWHVTFYGQSGVRFENIKSGIILSGQYELYEVDDNGYYDEEGNYISQYDRYIGLTLYDDQTQERYVYDWKISLLTRNKLNFGEIYSNGNYACKMVKI